MFTNDADIDSWLDENGLRIPSSMEIQVINSFDDATEHLTLHNRSLHLLNNTTSGWQKNVPCSIAYTNTHCISSLLVSTTRHNTLKPCVLVWLASEDNVCFPITCKLHPETITNPIIRNSKISFNLSCGGKCYNTMHKDVQLCIVVVEYIASQRQYRWNYVKGNFRKLYHTVKQQTEPFHVNTHCHSCIELSRKLDILSTDVNNLQRSLDLLLANQRQFL